MQKRSEYVGDAAPQNKAWRARALVSGSEATGGQTPARPQAPASIPTWHIRSRTSQALVEAEIATHHRQLWDHASIGFLVVDSFGEILSSNLRAGEMLHQGRARSAGVTLSSSVRGEDVVPLQQYLNSVFRGENVASLDVQLASRDEDRALQTIRLTAVSVASLSAAFTLTDVSELKQLQLENQQTEAQLRQLQRLELVHAMSAGIAHDFKNIMQVIETYAAIMNGQLQASDDKNPVAQQIMIAASRGTMLANRWMAFGRHGELQKQKVDVGQFVRERMECIETALDPSIRIEMQCGPGSIRCELDPCLIEQVLFNLCLNARDAMPAGGILRVGVERAAFDSPEGSQGLLPAGLYAKITVADNGTGMDAETLDRIFEPFFTTKASHAGTGLGLALVRGIISEHQGAIEVWSEPGVGSEFTVFLPASE